MKSNRKKPAVPPKDGAGREAQNLERKLVQRAKLPPLSELERYTMDEAAIYLRLSKVTLYSQIALGKLQSIKEGKRRFIPGSEIARLSSLPAAQA